MQVPLVFNMVVGKTGSFVLHGAVSEWEGGMVMRPCEIELGSMP